MTQRDEQKPTMDQRMGVVLFESGVDLDDLDSVVRVLIERGFAVADIIANQNDAVWIARGCFYAAA